MRIDAMTTDNSCSIVIDGNDTDISFKVYSNRILLVVTQYKKFGSVITVDKNSALKTSDSDIYTVKTLFGIDELEIHVAARYIAEQTKIDRTLLLTISLKDYSVETLKRITAIINEIKVW